MEWVTLPPAAPGIVLSKEHGVVAVDEVIALEANDMPSSPLLTVKPLNDNIICENGTAAEFSDQ
tara:strand:+ start:32152 stop:32343 length:192 start_codon:yes stop_codon:yes gene_type:complete